MPVPSRTGVSIKLCRTAAPLGSQSRCVLLSHFHSRAVALRRLDGLHDHPGGNRPGWLHAKDCLDRVATGKPSAELLQACRAFASLRQ